MADYRNPDETAAMDGSNSTGAVESAAQGLPARPVEGSFEVVSPPRSGPSPWPARVFRIGLVALAACLLTIAFLVAQYVQLGRLHRDDMLASVRAATSRAIAQFVPVVRGVEEGARGLLRADGEPSTEATARAALEALLERHPEVEACGLVVRTDPTLPPLALQVVRGRSTLEVRSLPPSSITALDRQASHPGWQEPVVDAPRRTLVLRYLVVAPSSRPERAGTDLAYVDLSLASVRAIVDRIDPGDRGFSTLVSPAGQFMVAPEKEAVLMGANESVASPGSPTYVLAHRPATPSGELSLLHEGIPCRILYDQVPSTRWTLAVTWLVEEHRNSRELQRLLLWIGVVVVFTLCSLVVTFLARGYQGRQWRLWTGSVLVTVFLLCGTLFTWYLVLADRLDQGQRPASWSEVRLHGTTPPLSDAAGISRFEQLYRHVCRERKRSAPTFLPTGVWIDSLEFISANNVKVSGLIWQRYPTALPADVPRGIRIPDALDLKVSEDGRSTEGDVEVIRWRFEGTLRQRIDYSRYPLDRATIRLRVLPQALPRRELMPVPDAASYIFLKPREAPGVRNDIVLSGWTLRESRFAYFVQSYESDFGTNDPNTIHLEFCFEVDFQRDFLQAFIVNIVQFFVIAALLFALLVISSRDESLASRFGVTATGVLSTCSGLLFATLLAHSKLRTDFASQGSIIYLEYLYFILYFLIAAVPVHAFLVAADVRVPLLSERDDMLPKLLFWPFVLAVILGLSIWFFY